ncbi:hypothetical protein FRC08_000441 [Ceratobasidium sp. 394]|nr:hypothetical protein FRC08_000441 [Ceratobasidium sp. 394]
MEADEEPGARERCFCCGKRLGPRQLRRHLHNYLDNIEAEFAAAGDYDGGGDDNDDGLLDNAGPAANGDEIGAGDIASEDGAGEMQAFADGQAFEHMDLGPDNDPLPLPPDDALPPLEPGHVHELRRNPPVHIHDWPDPGSDNESEGAGPVDEPFNGPDQDPPYDEQAAHQARDELNHLNELNLRDDDVWAALEMQLGDLADEAWMDLYRRSLNKLDEATLRLISTCICTHFSRETYNELRLGLCEDHGIPSEFIALRRLRILAGLQMDSYDCCVNSCCCFLGKYEHLDICPFCDEPQYTAAGHTRRSFNYTPLIPQLRALYRSPEMVEKLRYWTRAEEERDPNLVQDVFDGEHYRELRGQRPDPNSDYQFFDNPEDVAIRFSTDGFTLFKRRRQLLRLERGVEAIKAAPAGEDGAEPVCFVLRAFLIMVFGDIPVISKLLTMKGHNAKIPCRACYLQGVLCQLPGNLVYYMPLTLPGEREGFPPELLLMRSHDLFLFHYNSLDAQDAHPRRRALLAQECGINGRPILAHLKSFNLAACAPYDIMHLLFENLVPNMIRHWTGTFKHLDQGTGNYEIAPKAWKAIGRLTHEAESTIPAAFVGTLPNIEQDRNLYKAEAYAFWAQYIGPIVLQGRLPQRYHRHYLLMREIILMTVQVDITNDDINRLERMVNRWVNQYEE